DACVMSLKDGVAPAMPRDVAYGGPRWQRRGRPEPAAVFIANVERFASCTGHRIVVPGRKSKLVRIPRPRVAAHALGNHGAKTRIRDDIHPRRGRGPIARADDDVLASIRREAADAIEESQILSRHLACGESTRPNLRRREANNPRVAPDALL